MATPTPMKHALSQQGRTPSQSQHGAAATPPVSTPFSVSAHAAFSPLGPRSSPQHFKKSPANSNTLMGHSGTAPVNFDSPSAAAALGALGITGGLELALDNVGVGGLGALGTLGRGEDDERAKRLQAILGILKRDKGRVSEEGLERLARTTGLECMWDPPMAGDKTRTLVIAGSTLTLDIAFSSNIVQKVTLTFPESNEFVTRHNEKAGQILFDDLKLQPCESPLMKPLAKFAANLERLALLDQLSVLPALDLHEAIAGIYESLGRLYKWDLEKLREDAAMSGKGEDALAVTVLCTRHGLPLLHARDRLGLSLDYWKEQRHVRAFHENTKATAEAAGSTWRILIGCVPIGALVYPPVRVSDTWLSDAVVKLNPTEEDLLVESTGPILDWHDPDTTLIPASEDAKLPAAADGIQADPNLAPPKLPEVIFNAKFDPPVTVPFSVWHQIYQLIGLTPDPEFSLVTFDSISFPIPPGSNPDPSEPRTITCTKATSLSKTNGGPSVKYHKNTLFIYKPVYGRSLEELPFSHPSQLVRMLPTLRQYAFLSTLLEKSFDTKMTEIIREREDQDTIRTTTVKSDFATFMADDEEASKSRDAVDMDAILTAHPIPRLQVLFPFRNGTANVMLEIRVNGSVHVVSQNIFDEAGEDSEAAGKGKGKHMDPQDLGRLLEVCEDLGLWCEWIRIRCA